MSTGFAIRSIIEGIAVIGIILGLIFEDRLADAQDRLFGAVKRLFRRSRGSRTGKKAIIIRFPTEEVNSDRA